MSAEVMLNTKPTKHSHSLSESTMSRDALLYMFTQSLLNPVIHLWRVFDVDFNKAAR